MKPSVEDYFKEGLIVCADLCVNEGSSCQSCVGLSEFHIAVIQSRNSEVPFLEQKRSP